MIPGLNGHSVDDITFINTVRHCAVALLSLFWTVKTPASEQEWDNEEAAEEEGGQPARYVVYEEEIVETQEVEVCSCTLCWFVYHGYAALGCAGVGITGVLPWAECTQYTRSWCRHGVSDPLMGNIPSRLRRAPPQKSDGAVCHTGYCPAVFQLQPSCRVLLDVRKPALLRSRSGFGA